MMDEGKIDHGFPMVLSSEGSLRGGVSTQVGRSHVLVDHADAFTISADAPVAAFTAALGYLVALVEAIYASCGI